MKIKITLIALLLCVCQFASAQSQDSTTLYRHHLGINTRIVLDRIADPASRMPLQLMYKYQLSRTGAIRIGAEGMYAKSDSTQSYTERRDEITDYALGGSVGYEWQKPLNKRFMLYYGADIFHHQQRKNVMVINTYQNSDQHKEEVYIDDRYTTKKYGLNSFIGLRMHMSSRFYLATETALNLANRISTRDYYATVTVFSNGEGVTYNYNDYLTKQTILSFLPFNSINATYLF